MEIIWEDAQNESIENSIYSELSGKTVLITGATGLIGSQIARTLICKNSTLENKIKIIIMARSYSKIKKKFGKYLEEDYLSINISDINEKISLKDKVDYIIHSASPTSSVSFILEPINTIDTIYNGTKNILEFAKKSNVTKIVFLSTNEVYGIPNENKIIGEKDFGYLDPLEVRSSYPEGKRLAECLCSAYLKEYKLPIVICRLGVVFGPEIEKNDNRVIAQFARNIVNEEDINLYTRGETVRSYCYISDAVSGIISAMLNGTIGEAYNVANDKMTKSIAEIGMLLCEKYKKSKLNFVKVEDVNKLGYLPELKVAVDTSKLKGLGWKPKHEFEKSFDRIIRHLEQNNIES